MASIGSEQAPRSVWRSSWRISSCIRWRSSWRLSSSVPWGEEINGAVARGYALFTDGSDSSLVRRLAGAAFIIRVASAAIAFISQILLARWMGSFEFGIYIYAWTWVLLIGGMADLGLASAAQRFIPEYTEHKKFALLRGFLQRQPLAGIARYRAPSRARARSQSSCCRRISIRQTIVPLYLSCPMLAMFALWQVLGGIARSYNWVNLGLSPVYVLRQLMLLVLMGLAYAFGLPTDAVTATIVGVITLLSVGVGQLVILNRRLAGVVESGPRAYEPRAWLAVSAPIFVVEAFYLLLSYSDVIVLQQFRPANEVAIYYATVKTLALVAFIYYSVAQTIAHKFAEYHVTGDRQAAGRFREAIGAADVLAVARRDCSVARARAAAAAPVRRRLRVRLLSDVHYRHRPVGARFGRSSRTASQHARRAALLRAGLRDLVRARSGALRRAHSPDRACRCCDRQFGGAGV